MARTQTDAEERTRQNRRVADEVSAELGRKVGVREAVRHRKAQKEEPLPPAVRYQVVDRVVEFEASDCRRVGQVLARVVDFKIVRGGLALLSLQSAASEFGHTLTDASLIAQGHPLLITLDELFPATGDDGAD